MWQLVIYALVLTHITIASVTIFLHRSQAHRELGLHPLVMHFFGFWLWLTTGMVTKEWVAIHRKHHAKCEREGDPHSPMMFGVWKVLFCGAELYRFESKNKETLAKFGYGTPDDWVERNVYTRFSAKCILIMLAINVALFGAMGVTIWAIQMAWIPFWAAGVVTGIGHFWGYRNFASPDTTTNLVPWGIVIGGEELHNNHHAYDTSAKFSSKWYEFDIGWMYISVLKALGLAKIKKVAPKLRLECGKVTMDLQTLQGVITHRYEIMARYDELLKASACAAGCIAVTTHYSRPSEPRSTRHWHWRPIPRCRAWCLCTANWAAFGKALAPAASNCWPTYRPGAIRAQQSGIDGLEQFALRLRRYAA